MEEKRLGTLWVCGTPIGNLRDITLRALDTLRAADVIACEDTRQAKKILAEYGVRRPLVSYHAHSARSKSEAILERLKSGSDVAVITDAGTPGVSDPGAQLVSEAHELGIPVRAVPGPSALMAAVSVSGFPSRQVFFEGFLPRTRGRRRVRLEELNDSKALERATIVFFESPRRALESLEDILDVMGDRTAVLARELTKVHEEVRRGPLSHLLGILKDRTIRGEIVLLVGPGGKKIGREAGRVLSEAADMVSQLMSKGLTRGQASKLASRRCGLTRNEAYSLSLAQYKTNPSETEPKDKGKPS